MKVNERIFFDSEPGTGAPAPAAPSPLPAPPQDTGTASVNVRELYRQIYDLTNEVNGLRKASAESEAAHAAQLAETAEKVNTYDELKAQYEKTQGALLKYKEHAFTQLKKRYEGLDEHIRDEFKLEEMSDDPLAGFGAFDKREADLAVLRERMALDATKGDDDSANGNPDKGADPERKITHFDGPGDVAKYMKEKGIGTGAFGS